VEDAFITIDEGDRALGGGGVGEGWVVNHQSEVVRLAFDMAKIQRPNGLMFDRDLVCLPRAIVGDRHSIRAHANLPHLSINAGIPT